MGILKREFAFVLPIGYNDKKGNIHKKGTMRIGTALDEIEASGRPEVKRNRLYFSIYLLSEVVTGLGSLDRITPHVIQNLYLKDCRYLQEMYNRINQNYGEPVLEACPHCKTQVDIFLNVQSAEEIRTELDFTLPVGYTSDSGNLCKNGAMKLALIEDQLKIAEDPRVLENEYFEEIIWLARNVKLEGIPILDTGMVGKFCSQDYHYLMDMYGKINQLQENHWDILCPACKNVFPMEYLGESLATLSTASTRR